MLPEEFDWRHIFAAIAVFTVIVIAATAVPSFYTDVNPDIGKMAVIPIEGPIMAGSSQGPGIGSDSVTPDTVRELTKRAEDDGADVILYEINSPGGAVVASKDVARVVEEADAPTVCMMKDTAASGAFWTAMACDRVVADELTLTGSIGVSSTYLEFSELLGRYGVEYVNLTSGEYKDMGSQFKNLTPDERAKFDDILGTVHDSFIQSVADNRNMSVEEVRDAATGEVFLGQRAKEIGFVDTLGAKDAAKDEAKNLTGADRLKEKEYSPPQRFNFLSLLFSKIGEGIAEGMKSEEGHGLQARYTQP